ncbi:hypothetical protein D3C84_423290 [compost metagenome]
MPAGVIEKSSCAVTRLLLDQLTLTVIGEGGQRSAGICAGTQSTCIVIRQSSQAISRSVHRTNFANQFFEHRGAVVPGCGIDQGSVTFFLDPLPGSVVAVLDDSSDAIDQRTDPTSLVVKRIAAHARGILDHNLATGGIINIRSGARCLACCCLRQAKQLTFAVVGLRNGQTSTVGDRYCAVGTAIVSGPGAARVRLTDHAALAIVDYRTQGDFPATVRPARYERLQQLTVLVINIFGYACTAILRTHAGSIDRAVSYPTAQIAPVVVTQLGKGRTDSVSRACPGHQLRFCQYCFRREPSHRKQRITVTDFLNSQPLGVIAVLRDLTASVDGKTHPVITVVGQSGDLCGTGWRLRPKPGGAVQDRCRAVADFI